MTQKGKMKLLGYIKHTHPHTSVETVETVCVPQKKHGSTKA